MVGFVFTGVLGILLHFLFDWTNGSVVAALFSAVNESIWEHTKLFQKEYRCRFPSWAAITVLALIATAYTVLTFYPPHIPLFQDPISDTYGYFEIQ